MPDIISLAIPAFFAGLFTFFAPCTLPLVPAFLAFITGIPTKDMVVKKNDRTQVYHTLFQTLYFVCGFSMIFILFGTIAGVSGHLLIEYRRWIAIIGGLCIIFFGLQMMQIFKLPIFNFLQTEKRFHLTKKLTPGTPIGAFIFGITLALGWTPCIGPVLGSILLLASHTATIFTGGGLLAIFSLGLAVPFLTVGLAYNSLTPYLKKISGHLQRIEFFGGVLLVILGILFMTNQIDVWLTFFYRFFDIINYQGVLDYL